MAVLWPILGHGQIVNVELNRLSQDSMGWQGLGELSIYNVRNTANLLKANASMQLQHSSAKSVLLIVSDAHLILAGDDNLEQEAHGHIRYGRQVKRWLTWEAFVQTQVDQVLGIRNRSLIGSGPKFAAWQDSTKQAFIGFSAMYEHLEEIGTGIIRDQLRMNSFISMRLNAAETFSAYGIAYFQPLLHKPEDIRLVGTFVFSIQATRSLGLTTKLSYAYNSHPVQIDNINSFNYKISQGLSLQF